MTTLSHPCLVAYLLLDKGCYQLGSLSMTFLGVVELIFLGFSNDNSGVVIRSLVSP